MDNLVPHLTQGLIDLCKKVPADPVDALADFLLTNSAARVEARTPVVAQALAQSLGKVPSDAAVRLFLGVDSKYLEAALEAIDREAGSLEAYLAGIGVDAKATGALQDRYLA
jgi:protein tyrosine/serine phosphatase